MARLVCALLVLAVATASASDSRIVGGYPSSVEENPSVVQIQASIVGIYRHICAGVIVTSRFTLTSCQCVAGPDFVYRLRRVIAGSTYRNVKGQVSELARVVKHPYWNEGLDRDGDIAMLELATPLQYSTVVQQATILGQGAYVPDNMPAVQVGWGLTLAEEFPALFSDRLRKLNVVTINNQRCALTYRESKLPLTVTANMLCAGTIGDAGACLGDRGGPLVINGITVGLVSWGRGCTNNTYPTVHTAISSFTNWIVDQAR